VIFKDNVVTMKKTFLFSTIFVFGQMIFAQINLDSIWQNFVVDNYAKLIH